MYDFMFLQAMMMGFDQSPPAYLLTISVGNKLSRQANGVNFASGSSGVLDSTVNYLTD